MTRLTKTVLAGSAVLLAGLWILAPGATARASGRTPEMAQKERRSCVTCHTALGRPELNEAGQYYREHESFEGYPGTLPPREGEEPARPTPPPAPAPPR